MNKLKTLPLQVSQRIVDLAIADTKLQECLKEQRLASHRILWAEVHKEYPELEKEAGYTLKCEYAEQGIVMLETSSKPEGRGLGEFLSKVLKDM